MWPSDWHSGVTSEPTKTDKSHAWCLTLSPASGPACFCTAGRGPALAALAVLGQPWRVGGFCIGWHIVTYQGPTGPNLLRCYLCVSDMAASGALKSSKNRAASDGHGCVAWSKHVFSSPPPPPAYDLSLIFKESSSWKLFSPSFSHFQSGFFLLADNNSRVNVISGRHLGEFISIWIRLDEMMNW